MRRAAIFVLSDVRSGTTLLDQCLGGNEEVASLGEVHWLRAYVRQDRAIYDPIHPLVCSCSLSVGNCPFWLAVRKVLGRPLDALELRSNIAHRKGLVDALEMLRYVPRRLVRARPGLYRHRVVQRVFSGERLARDCIALFDAVTKVSARPYCVDSSKSPFRFRVVYGFDPEKTRAIVMARDYRAVVHSKMRRGESLESAAAGWNRAMNQIEDLTGDLPSSAVLRLKYEALCESPDRELRRICDFLGLTFSRRMGKRPTGDVHHIGGSPSKFDSNRIAINLDRSHERVFKPEALESMRRIVTASAERWSY